MFQSVQEQRSCSVEGLQDEDQQPELHVVKGKKKPSHPNEVIQFWSEFLSQLFIAVPAGCTDS